MGSVKGVNWKLLAAIL